MKDIANYIAEGDENLRIELLVNKELISNLDLPIELVYKKKWLPYIQSNLKNMNKNCKEMIVVFRI